MGLVERLKEAALNGTLNQPHLAAITIQAEAATAITSLIDVLKDVQDGLGCQPGYVAALTLTKINDRVSKYQPEGN